MTRRTMFKLSPLALVLVVPLAWTSPEPPAPMGAPWIALEAPANPMDPATRDAAFVVRAYYHERPVGYEVTGTAEGLVDGRRESIELDVRATSQPGVYAVIRNWPDEGRWVVNLASGTPNAPVTLLAELGPNGGVVGESVFGGLSASLALGSIQVVSGKVAAERVDTALRAMATGAD